MKNNCTCADLTGNTLFRASVGFFSEILFLARLIASCNTSSNKTTFPLRVDIFYRLLTSYQKEYVEVLHANHTPSFLKHERVVWSEKIVRFLRHIMTLQTCTYPGDMRRWKVNRDNTFISNIHISIFSYFSFSIMLFSLLLSRWSFNWSYSTSIKAALLSIFIPSKNSKTPVSFHLKRDGSIISPWYHSTCFI